MTLVLRYLDRERFISVADTRITLSDEDDNITGYYDGRVSKAFFVCGCLVSYSGLATLNSYGDVELTTRDWVSDGLKEGLAEGKDIIQTLGDMASLLSGNLIIDPEYKQSVLDIRLIGLSPASADFEPEDDGDDFDEDSTPSWMLVITGYITNTKGKWKTASFDSNAEHYVPVEGERYTSHGADLPPITKARLDVQIDDTTSTIDIVNHFVAAVRETADFDPKDTVGRTVTVSVVPLQALANAAGLGELRFSERDDAKLAEGYISYAVVAKDVARATMVPQEQVHFVETDSPPTLGGFAG